MRIVNRLFTFICLVALGSAAAFALKIQPALRFMVLPINAHMVSGNPKYPGVSSNTTHAFSVTSDLSEGFKIQLDPNGPTMNNGTRMAYDFILAIFVVGIWVAVLNLGNLDWAGTSEKTVRAADLPRPIEAGQHITLSGFCFMESGFTLLKMRCCFDLNGTSDFQYLSPSPFIDSGPEFYAPYAFAYEPSALTPTLTFNPKRSGYHPYGTGPVIIGYSDAIAANYETELVFNISAGEGPDPWLATSTLHHDNGNGTLGGGDMKIDLFGERLNENVANETQARYTDHEFGGTTGFTYMKGRFQLANYTKFNRPDPRRQWDRMQLHTINLYEYVSDDPINAWDLTGFFGENHVSSDTTNDFSRKGKVINYNINVSGNANTKVTSAVNEAGICITRVNISITTRTFIASVKDSDGNSIQVSNGVSVSSKTENNTVLTEVLNLGNDLTSSPDPTTLISQTASHSDLLDLASNIHGNASAGQLVSGYSSGTRSVVEGVATFNLQRGTALGVFK